MDAVLVSSEEKSSLLLMIPCIAETQRNATLQAPRADMVMRMSRLHLLRTVLVENKELVIGPAFTLIPQLFSLPYFIALLSLRCQNIQTSGLRYLLIASYLPTFIPPLMSFPLYISPSSFYSQQWRATTLSKWLVAFQRRHELPSVVTRSMVASDRPN